MGILDLLNLMARRSAEMVVAAQENDWPRLVALEQNLAMDRAHLEAIDPDGRMTRKLTLEEQGRKADLIRHILADGEKIMGHVQPYQDSVRRLLSTSTVGRSLRQAYAVGP